MRENHDEQRGERRPTIIPGGGFGWSDADPDPFGGDVPEEHAATFLSEDEIDALIAMLESSSEDDPIDDLFR